jgi:hypothetical protein
MQPQDQKRYDGTQTSELELLLRNSDLTAAERSTISQELARRYAQGYLAADPGRQTSAQPQTDETPSHGKMPLHQIPVERQQPSTEARVRSTATPAQSTQPGKPKAGGRAGIVLLIFAIVAILIGAIVASHHGSDSTSNSPSYATECVTPYGSCPLPPGPIGVTCHCGYDYGTSQ